MRGRRRLENGGRQQRPFVFFCKCVHSAVCLLQMSILRRKQGDECGRMREKEREYARERQLVKVDNK